MMSLVDRILDVINPMIIYDLITFSFLGSGIYFALAAMNESGCLL